MNRLGNIPQNIIILSIISRFIIQKFTFSPSTRIWTKFKTLYSKTCFINISIWDLRLNKFFTLICIKLSHNLVKFPKIKNSNSCHTQNFCFFLLPQKFIIIELMTSSNSDRNTFIIKNTLSLCKSMYLIIIIIYCNSR